jgi:hypothetical protein
LPTPSWDTPAAASVSLSGFVAGATNTISFVGDGIHPAPDLDWIEVVGATSDYCDHTRWSLSASSFGSQDPPLNSIDGLPQTRWTSGKAQNGTEWFQVSFGGSVKMSTLTLTNGSYDPNDYPGAYELYASTDGITFGATPIATGLGTPNATVMTFPEQVMQAVRIRQTAATNTKWWSIHEFDSDCSLPPPPPPPANFCDGSTWTATSNVGTPASGIDRSMSTEWTTSRDQSSGDFYKVDFGGTVKLSGLTLKLDSNSTNEYPGTFALYASTDGATFPSTPFYSGSGTYGSSTVISFSQRSMRAVKLVVTKGRSTRFSIGELQATCSM